MFTEAGFGKNAPTLSVADLYIKVHNFMDHNISNFLSALYFLLILNVITLHQ